MGIGHGSGSTVFRLSFMSQGVRKTSKNVAAPTAAAALRDRLFNQITPILISSELVADSAVRALLCSCSHELVAAVEEIIQSYELEKSEAKRLDV